MAHYSKHAIATILVTVMASVFSLAVGIAEEDKIDAHGQWWYVLEDGSAKIMSYVGVPSGALSIPSELNGYAVTGLGGDDAIFVECNTLTSIDIPDGVTNIGDSAFAYCSNLTSVNIPASVESIGPNPFVGCPSVYIDVSSNNQMFEYTDGVLFDKQRKILISYQESKEGAYTIPQGVLLIGDFAFLGCDGLTSVTIPDSVTSIGDSAFALCQNQSLTSTTIPDGVTSIGDGAFNRCTYLTSINIPDGVTSISASTFAGCFGLTAVSIPDSVTSIGDSAFMGCGSLTNVALPASLINIDFAAFTGCGLTSVSIPASVTRIGNCAFLSCHSLTSVTIPSGTTSIGKSAFNDCENLTLRLTKGSLAEQYAKVNGIPYVYIE